MKTAGGENFNIVEKIIVPVEYNENVQNVTFYLCPSLSQELYLLIDFWRLFKLAPEVVDIKEAKTANNELAIAELNLEQACSYFGPPKVPGNQHKMHVLTMEQQSQLDEVKLKFPAFEKLGLGRTRLEQHTIQLIADTVPIKERHFPMSSAVQDIVFEEIDKMIKLGVIQESESPWSHRFTVVR